MPIISADIPLLFIQKCSKSMAQYVQRTIATGVRLPLNSSQKRANGVNLNDVAHYELLFANLTVSVSGASRFELYNTHTERNN